MGDRIEPFDFNGHKFYHLATHLVEFKPGTYFYNVSINYQVERGVTGNMSVHGLVKPREGCQYSQLYVDVIEVVRQLCDGRAGTKVVTFAHLAPNVQL